MSRLVALCLDANDPLHLARFWADALRWQVGDGTEDEVGVVPTDGTGFRFVVRRVSGVKVGKNRIHLDLTTASVADQQHTVETLVELGARHINVGQGPDDAHVVLADPEGNEFCVIEPTNSFLASCGRLGSITCDGSPQVGYFWSEALGWPLVWDQDGETAIRDVHGSGPFITWGPPVPPMTATSRLHLQVAPSGSDDQRTEVDRLSSLGATRLDTDPRDVNGVAMADPDGNEFRVLRTRA